MTKNQSEKLFTEHEQVLMNGILPYRREDVEEALRSEESNTERAPDTRDSSKDESLPDD